MSDMPTIYNTHSTQMLLNSRTTEQSSTLTFARSGIQINMETGRVTIPKELTLDTASRAFWQAIWEAFQREKRSFCGQDVTKTEGLE